MMHFYNTLTIKKSKTNKQIIKTIFSYFISLTIFCCIALLIANPKKYTLSITNGFLLFANAVFPGLFPFLILTKMLTSFNAIDKIAEKFSRLTTRVFKISGIASFVFLISALCGYPMGAKTTEDLLTANKISKEEAPYIFMLSSVSGPMFIIGAIGSGMLASVRAGIIIYIAHIVAAILCSTIFCNNKKRKTILKNVKNQQIINKNNSFGDILSNSVYSSIQTILIVGAYITMFFMFIDMLIGAKILSPITLFFKQILSILSINPNLASGLSSGLIEITRGSIEISKFGINPFTISFICLIVSFGGFSIITQSLTLAKNAKPNTFLFIFYKFCHAIVSFCICFGLCKIFL